MQESSYLWSVLFKINCNQAGIGVVIHWDDRSRSHVFPAIFSICPRYARHSYIVSICPRPFIPHPQETGGGHLTRAYLEVLWSTKTYRGRKQYGKRPGCQAITIRHF